MTDETGKPRELSDDERDRMVAAKEHVVHQWPRRIAVGGHTYSVKQISKRVRAKIHSLELEAYALSGTQKDTLPLRKAQRVQKKLDTLHAKTAAYYLLGNASLAVPFLHAITWRRLMLRSEEEVATINATALNDEEVGFYLANWENTKQQLALSMKPIGDGVRETLKRWQAAESQAATDATPKKAEDNRSGVSSPKRPTMKK